MIGRLLLKERRGHQFLFLYLKKLQYNDIVKFEGSVNYYLLLVEAQLQSGLRVFIRNARMFKLCYIFSIADLLRTFKVFYCKTLIVPLQEYC